MEEPVQGSAGGVGGESTATRMRETFSLLDNDVRLGVLVALWEAVDEAGESVTLRFSELYDRVDYDHRGNFSYHLKKLAPFVARTDDGYRLTPPGRKLVRLVVSGVGSHAAEREPVPHSKPCPRCDGGTAVVYRDGWLFLVCTACGGFYGGRPDLPDGTLSGGEFDPVAFEHHDAEGALHALSISTRSAIGMGLNRVCSDCGGSMDRSLVICDGHEDGLCGRCGRKFRAVVTFHCTVCKDFSEAPPNGVLLHHPAVVGFCYERGLDVQYDLDRHEKIVRKHELIRDPDVAVLSSDPPEVRVTFSLDGDALHLTLDGDLAVSDIVEELDAAS